MRLPAWQLYGLRIPGAAPRTEDEAVASGDVPVAEPWNPGDDTGWRDYHRQMFDLASAPNGFVRWKINSTGVNVARALMGARNRGRAAWVAQYGLEPVRWPLPHPPAVVWMPYMAHAACLRCTWIGSGDSAADDAASAAREHASEYLPSDSPALQLVDAPMPVWRRDGPYDEMGPTWAR